MKRVVLVLVMFFLFIVNVKAETIINDYKVEILLDNEDIFKVKESFKVESVDQEDKYWKIRSLNAWNYDTNLPDFERDFYESYVNYNRFKLESGKEYYLNYYVKDTKAKVGDFEYFDFFQIVKNYKDYDSVIYNNYYLVIRLEDGQELDLENIYNYKNMELSVDGNIITAYVEGPLNGLDSFEIKKKVIKEYVEKKNYVDNNNNKKRIDGPFNIDDSKISKNTNKIFLMYIPIAIFLINLFIVLKYRRNQKENISYDKDGKILKKYKIIILVITILSYFSFLSYRVILGSKIYYIFGVLLFMAFFSPFYYFFVYGAIFNEIRNAFLKDRVIIELFLLIPKLFIIIMSSIFAVIFCLGYPPFNYNQTLTWFYVGFFVNAISLNLINYIKNDKIKNK